MTDQARWEAVKTCNAAYDGIFFYAVKSTGIFCRPSCRSKQPKRENICFFDTAEQAQKAGFRPCKRCRSDLLAYQPMREIAEQVKQRLEQAAASQDISSNLLDGMGLTTRRLTDIFRQEYGMTPKEYADSLRLQTAKQCLSQSEDKIIDIAYSVGFSSLSAFNRFFKEHTHQTPTQYRREQHHLGSFQNGERKCSSSGK